MKNNLFTNDYVSSKRCIYTPSSFARTSLLYLQETGSLKAIRPHVSSRQNLQSYLLLLITEGSGWIEYEGKYYEMKKGDLALIDCKKGYSQSSNEDCWELKWAHFNSVSMPAIYNKYCERSGKCVFRPADTEPFIKILDDLYTTASSESYIRDVEINTLLSELIGLLFAETVYEENEKPARITAEINVFERIDAGEIKSYIDQNYRDHLSLEILADCFHFSKHYIARRFKEAFGVSIGSYIQLVRIGKAKELLRFSSITIEQCSYECGYGGDSNYFSRVFKKVEGCSPSEFRASWKNGDAKKDGN